MTFAEVVDVAGPLFAGLTFVILGLLARRGVRSGGR